MRLADFLCNGTILDKDCRSSIPFLPHTLREGVGMHNEVKKLAGSIGSRLQSLREQAGMSQQMLADASGVPIETIRNYEQGKKVASLIRAKKLANALGCSMDAFLVGVQLARTRSATA
jgi:DNA-binding XRE family transcriptional regulator